MKLLLFAIILTAACGIDQPDRNPSWSQSASSLITNCDPGAPPGSPDGCGGSPGGGGDAHECSINCNVSQDCNDSCPGLWTCIRSHGGGYCQYDDLVAPIPPAVATDAVTINPGWTTGCDPDQPLCDTGGGQGGGGTVCPDACTSNMDCISGCGGDYLCQDNGAGRRCTFQAPAPISPQSTMLDSTVDPGWETGCDPDADPFCDGSGQGGGGTATCPVSTWCDPRPGHGGDLACVGQCPGVPTARCNTDCPGIPNDPEDICLHNGYCS